MRAHRPILHYVVAVLPLVILLGVLAQWSGWSLVSDEALFRALKAHRAAHPGMRAFMKVVTDWGNAVFYVVYAWILYTGWRRGDKARIRFALTYVAVQLLVSFLVVRVCKIALGSPRPDAASPFAEPFSFRSSYNSLPSGHTTEIYGASLPLALRARRWIVPLGLGLFAALTASSRIYLGVHHPMDVFFGLLLGSLAGWAIHVYAGRGAGRGSGQGSSD